MKSVILGTCIVSVLSASSVSASVSPEECLKNYETKVEKIERRWHKIHRVEVPVAMGLGVGWIAASFVSLPLVGITAAVDLGITGTLSALYRRDLHRYYAVYEAVQENAALTPFISAGLSRVDQYKGESDGYATAHLEELRGGVPSMLSYAYDEAVSAYSASIAQQGRNYELANFSGIDALYDRLSREKGLRGLKYDQFTKLDLSLLLRQAVAEGALCSPEGEALPYKQFKTWIIEQVRVRF
jgi:hypothetical protein